jgi:hypothetical protein
LKIGEDVSEQLIVEPARFFLHYHTFHHTLAARARTSLPCRYRQRSSPAGFGVLRTQIIVQQSL